jgi:transposase-like protein
MTTKLSAEVVRECIRLHEEQGATFVDLARRYRCCARTISRCMAQRNAQAEASPDPVPDPVPEEAASPCADVDRYAPVLAQRLQDGAKLGQLLQEVPLRVVEDLAPRLQKLGAEFDAGLYERLARLE